MNPSTTRVISSTLPVLTVSQLTQAIQRSLEATFPLVWLQGEISNCTKQASGHLYFSLKDSHAQISAVMFRADAMRLKVLPRNGDQVKVLAELTLFAARGIYQLVVREVELMGIGQLLIKFEERKKALQERGWFSKERKRPLPHLPNRIGVVTSPTGAVIQDILHVLTRRYGNFHLILYPVNVQGEGAADEIARAIEQCNQYDLADVLIVGRGGGSIEDLWAFNEESVASAIFHSRIPIISAVGHETDYTIADWVADVRAPTPSAAAEMVLAEKARLLEQLTFLRSRCKQTLEQFLRRESIRLQGIKRHPCFLSLRPIMQPKMQQLDYLRTNINESLLQRLQNLRWQVDSLKKRFIPYEPTARILTWKQKLESLQRGIIRAFFAKQLLCAKQCNASVLQARFAQSFMQLYSRKSQRLRDLSAALRAVDPTAVVRRGYGLVFSEKKQGVITSVKSLKIGQNVLIRLSDGTFSARIEQVNPELEPSELIQESSNLA